jgi:hypothetical protein
MELSPEFFAVIGLILTVVGGYVKLEKRLVTMEVKIDEINRERFLRVRKSDE